MHWSLDQWRRRIGGWSGGSGAGGTKSISASGTDSFNQVLLWSCILLWLTIFTFAFLSLVRSQIIFVPAFVIWSCSQWWIKAVIQQSSTKRRLSIQLSVRLSFVILFLFLFRYASANDLGAGQSDAESSSLATVVASTVAFAQTTARVARVALRSITNQPNTSESSCDNRSSTNRKRDSTASGGGSGSTKKKKKFFTFTEESYEAFYAELISKAEDVPSSHSGHTRIADILDCDKMKSLICLIFQILSSHTRSKIRKQCTLEHVVKMFRAVDIDIYDFRDDIDEKFEKYELGVFLKMMLVYTIRKKQGACACCGREVEDFLFGAIGFESNHWEDDKDINGDTEGSKCFDICAGNFGRSLMDILFELAKTRLECWVCHNK